MAISNACKISAPERIMVQLVIDLIFWPAPQPHYDTAINDTPHKPIFQLCQAIISSLHLGLRGVRPPCCHDGVYQSDAVLDPQSFNLSLIHI